MNCYIDQHKNKFYCLNGLDKDCVYYCYPSTYNNNYINIYYLHHAFSDKKILLHREGAPSIEYANGNTCWHVMGKYHREDCPAIEHQSNGDKFWFYHGKQIRCKDNKEFLKIIAMKAFL